MSQLSVWATAGQFNKFKNIAAEHGALFGGKGSIAKLLIKLADGTVEAKYNKDYRPPDTIDAVERANKTGIGITLGNPRQKEEREDELKRMAKRLGYRNGAEGNISGLIQAIADGKLKICRVESKNKK